MRETLLLLQIDGESEELVESAALNSINEHTKSTKLNLKTIVLVI